MTKTTTTEPTNKRRLAWLFGTLFVAAAMIDAVNYLVGSHFGGGILVAGIVVIVWWLLRNATLGESISLAKVGPCLKVGLFNFVVLGIVILIDAFWLGHSFFNPGGSYNHWLVLFLIAVFIASTFLLVRSSREAA